MRKITFLKTMLLAAVLLVGSGNAWAVYSGTGTFAKITSLSDLTDGYYVILNSTEAFAMNSTNAGSFFTHTSVTPLAGTITNPATSIVWEVKSHIDGGRTIFNEVTSRYVSYTGSF